eukprot:262285-Lingulodinium_polyedra.AAC.1
MPKSARISTPTGSRLAEGIRRRHPRKAVRAAGKMPWSRALNEVSKRMNPYSAKAPASGVTASEARAL